MQIQKNQNKNNQNKNWDLISLKSEEKIKEAKELYLSLIEKLKKCPCNTYQTLSKISLENKTNPDVLSSKTYITAKKLIIKNKISCEKCRKNIKNALLSIKNILKEVVNANINIAFFTAKDIYQRIPNIKNAFELSDLRNEGICGLIKAFFLYDPFRLDRMSFKNYAFLKVKEEILTFARNTIEELSSSLTFIEDLKQKNPQNNNSTSDSHLETILFKHLKSFQNYFPDQKILSSSLLNTTLPAEKLLSLKEKESLKRILKKTMHENLSPEKTHILLQRFYENKTFKEIDKNKKEWTPRRKLAKVLPKLKTALKNPENSPENNEKKKKTRTKGITKKKLN